MRRMWRLGSSPVNCRATRNWPPAAFNARVIPQRGLHRPEVAWVGLTEDQAKAQGIKVKKACSPGRPPGRAIANGRDEGFTKLLFDDARAHGHAKILGGGIVGTMRAT